MLIKFSTYIRNLKNSCCLLFVPFLISCSTLSQNPSSSQNAEIEPWSEEQFTEGSKSMSKKTTYCSLEDLKKGIKTTYEFGDLVCKKKHLQLPQEESLRIHFVVTDKTSKDLYEYGYQELRRYRKGKLIEKLKLRRDDDAYWSETPFVRIRKQQYFSDLDGDGYFEFAIFPFHPGSAIWGTVRIFSLKEKIEFWGLGRLQFEGDTFVQLGCEGCSKLNPHLCRKCG